MASFQNQHNELNKAIIKCLCSVSCTTNLLPHIVYVEEEDPTGKTPSLYTMYQLETINSDGSCTLYNPANGAREIDRHLSEINTEWLISVWNYHNDLTSTQNQPIRSDNNQLKEQQTNKTMIKATVIFGEDAVSEYENTGTIPNEQWLAKNGGVVDEKTFRTKEEYDAYVQGAEDTDGWNEHYIF